MPTVLFSWRRDTPPKEGRNFLERALERAIALVADIVKRSGTVAVHPGRLTPRPAPRGPPGAGS